MATKFGQLAKAADINRKVLDLYDEYLLSKRDQRREADVLHWILTKNLETPRDRRGSWSASSSGMCMRSQQFTYFDFPGLRANADTQNIFDNGDFLHLRYQVAGIIGGWLDDVEIPVTYGSQVRGTMDGLLSWGEILELKSINQHGFAEVMEFGPKKRHRFQATAYMMANKKTVTRFVYENKDRNTNAEFVFELSDDYINQVREQWNELDRLNASQQLAPRLDDCKNNRGTDWKYCPFQKLCPSAVFPGRKLRLA